MKLGIRFKGKVKKENGKIVYIITPRKWYVYYLYIKIKIYLFMLHTINLSSSLYRFLFGK